MSERSLFADLGPAQLHYLKSQYIASLQVVDQTEQALKAQLEEVGRARSQLEEQLRELDRELEPPAKRSGTQGGGRPRSRARKTSSSRS